jgi:hypothetical protein
MGGIGGEIRAKTREEAWTEFDERIRPKIEDRFGLFLEEPSTQEAAWEAMWQDPKSHWWVLDYYFTK